MKGNEKDINRLTHDLLKCGTPQPSPGLADLIMECILKEAPLPSHQVVKSSTKPGIHIQTIIIYVVIYMILVSGLLFLMQLSPGGIENTLSGLKEIVPYLLTVGAIGGSLIFFSALDRVLAL